MSYCLGFWILKTALICWHSTATGLPLTGINPVSSSSSQPPHGPSLQLEFSTQQNEIKTFPDFILQASKEGSIPVVPALSTRKLGAD